MRKNGFTLIELLAVIVILAIIALIAVPIIIDIIEDSKTEALKRSAENYLKAVELAIAKENLNGEFNPNSCSITSGITTCGDKTLNVTVDGELPKSGTITLSNGIIEKTSSTKLAYKSGTLTYDSNGKLTIESSKKELIAEGERINETTSGVAINVDNKLVYYVPVGSSEATVYGYYGNIDYSSSFNLIGKTPQTSGDIEIASKLKINDEIYDVTSISYYAFSEPVMGGATNITSITIPSSITSIGSSAFQGCTNLSSITIPSSVTSIGASAFYGCSNLSSVTIPESVTSIGSSAFSGTPWLASKTKSTNGLWIMNNILLDGSAATGDLAIPDGVTSIDDGAFSSNINITSVTIPSSVTSIGENAFGNCTSLSSITIPSSVISIGNYAFSYSSSLSSITIPSSVTNMGEMVFGGWTSSQVINVYWNKSEGKPINWDENWKGHSMLWPSYAIVHCPDGDIIE